MHYSRYPIFSPATINISSVFISSLPAPRPIVDQQPIHPDYTSGGTTGGADLGNLNVI
jgi:hypothetical protein